MTSRLKAGRKNKKKIVIYFDQDVLKILATESEIEDIFLLSSVSLIKGWKDNEIAEEIRKTLKNIRLNNPQVFLNIPRHLATIKNISLPSTKSEEISSMVDFQVTRLVPYPKSEIVYSYDCLTVLPSQCTSVRVAVLPRKTVNHYLDVLKQARLFPDFVRLGSESLSFFLKKVQELSTIIEIDYAQTQVLLLENEKIHFSRSISIGSKDMSKSDVFEGLLTEIESSIALFPIDSDKKKLPLFLLAPEEIASKIKYALQEHFNTQIQFVEAPLKANTFQGEELASKVSFAPLISILKAPQDQGFNLLPLNIRQLAQRSIYIYEMKKVLVASLAALFLICLSFFNEIRLEEKFLSSLKMQIKGIEKEAKALEEIRNKILMLQDHIDARGKCLNIMNSFLQIIPDQIYLKALYYDPNKIGFRGYAPALSKVFELTGILEKNRLFQKIETRYARQGSVGREEVAEFQLECTLSPAEGKNHVKTT